VSLARDLIRAKLAGQRRNLSRLGVSTLESFDHLRESLESVRTIDQIRLCEAKAAAIYWNGWGNVRMTVRGRDLARMPAHWARFETRASILTRSPRAATNPTNALLNLVYRLAEAEARLALLAAGCDPTLGVLHADHRNRDSFALDAMEPIRPNVDAFVLDLLEGHTFTAREFVELPNGVCRVRAPLTHDLALTLPRWRGLVGPIVASLAQRFREALRSPTNAVAPQSHATPAAAAPIVRVGGNQRPTSAQSPLQAMPQRRSKVRPFVSKEWSAPRPEPLALVPLECPRCGASILKRRRRVCDACMRARIETPPGPRIKMPPPDYMVFVRRDWMT
jgi:hypothetical protein